MTLTGIGFILLGLLFFAGLYLIMVWLSGVFPEAQQELSEEDRNSYCSRSQDYNYVYPKLLERLIKEGYATIQLKFPAPQFDEVIKDQACDKLEKIFNEIPKDKDTGLNRRNYNFSTVGDKVGCVSLVNNNKIYIPLCPARQIEMKDRTITLSLDMGQPPSTSDNNPIEVYSLPNATSLDFFTIEAILPKYKFTKEEGCPNDWCQDGNCFQCEDIRLAKKRGLWKPGMSANECAWLLDE